MGKPKTKKRVDEKKLLKVYDEKIYEKSARGEEKPNGKSLFMALVKK